MDGYANYLVCPNNVLELKSLINFIKDNNLKYKIIGNGSNLIFNGNYNGILIKLNKLNNLEINDTIVTVEAGYNLQKLAYKTAKLGLSGLEFASGIPATIGGSVFMNAGAYNASISDLIKEALVLTPQLEIIMMTKEQLNFSYRTSFFQANKNYICLGVTFSLTKGDVQDINALIEERRTRRIATQPLEYPSAGSVFRNPPNDSAWRLITEAGFKGKEFNNVLVSEKHANFIINPHGSNGKYIVELIREIQKEVKDKFKVDLILEQEIVE